jgi:hypothetical protein
VLLRLARAIALDAPEKQGRAVQVVRARLAARDVAYRLLVSAIDERLTELPGRLGSTADEERAEVLRNGLDLLDDPPDRPGMEREARRN